MTARRSVDWGAISNQLKVTVGKSDKPRFEKKKEGEFWPGEEWKADLFKPKLKDDGTYNCVIRFLPRKEGDQDGNPFVPLKRHQFQLESGKWFIQNCPETHKDSEKCPVCNEYRRLYKIDEAVAKKRKSKVKYYANILIVSDKINPDNEGKVFLLEIDVKMFNLIWEKMFPPQDSDEEPVMVADYDQGMDFRLKIKTKTITLNGKPTPVQDRDASQFTGIVRAMTDDEVDKAEKNLISLDTIVDKKNFKTPAEIKELYDKQMGDITFGGVSKQQVSYTKPKFDEDEDEAPVASKFVPVNEPDDEDDDDAAFLAKIRRG